VRSGRRGILAWTAVALAAGGVAFGLGALGLFSQPGESVAQVAVVGSVASGQPAYDCPDGEPVAQFAAGSRLYVTGRNADATWLLTRSPASGYESAWVPAGLVSVDDLPTTIDELAIVSCDAVVVEGGGPAG
jgi:hypothetical protein